MSKMKVIIYFCLIFSSIAANVKIDPRMGPIQGVQPNPKAAPTSNGKAKLVTILISKNSYVFVHKFKINNSNKL